MYGKIRLCNLEQNLEAFRPSVCAVADALDDLRGEELVEAVDWRLGVVQLILIAGSF